MPPVLIAGAVTAAATIGGAALSSSASKKAASKAADTSIQTTQMNNALARDIYGQNSANFRPYLDSGARANALLDSFIYGPQSQQPQAGAAPMSVPLPGQPNALMGGTSLGSPRFAPPSAYYDGAAQPEPEAYPQAPQGGVSVPAPQAAPVNGWETFQNSPTYQSPLQQGYKGLNMNYGARGTLQSGAAMKGITRFGQDYASGRLNDFLGLVRGQQQVGFGGASALAGVGQNYVGNVTANNNLNASNVANAALLQGQAQGQFYGGVANALGGFAGSLGSSYGPKWGGY